MLMYLAGKIQFFLLYKAFMLSNLLFYLAAILESKKKLALPAQPFFIHSSCPSLLNKYLLLAFKDLSVPIRSSSVYLLFIVSNPMWPVEVNHILCF